MSRLLVSAIHYYVVTKMNQLKLLPFDFTIKTCFWRSCVKSDGLPVPNGVSLDIENYCTVSLFFEQAYL